MLNQIFHQAPLNLSSLKLGFILTAIIIFKCLYLVSQLLNHLPYRNIIDCFHCLVINHLYSNFIFINHQFIIQIIILNHQSHPNLLLIINYLTINLILNFLIIKLSSVNHLHFNYFVFIIISNLTNLFTINYFIILQQN